MSIFFKGTWAECLVCHEFVPIEVDVFETPWPYWSNWKVIKGGMK